MMGRFIAILLSFGFAVGSAKAESRIKEILVNPASEASFVKTTLPFREGEIWIEEYYQVSERFLTATGRYERFRLQWDAESSVFRVEVVPKEFFDSIVWQGDQPPGKSRIRNACIRRLEERQLTQSRLNELSSCLLNQLRSIGYLDANVLVFGDGEDLVIESSLGEVYRVSKVEFEGVNLLRSNLIEVRLRNQRDQIFLPFKVQEDTERIQSYYRDRGYFQAEVSQPSIRVMPGEKRVELVWEIREGDRYHISVDGSFRGPDIVDRVLETGDSLPEWFLDEIEEELRVQFRSLGFLDVVVTREEKRRFGNQVDVNFKVARGKQYWLERPEWVGVSQVDRIESIYLSVPELRPGKRFHEPTFRKVFEEKFFPELARAGFLDVSVRTLEFSVDTENARVRPLIFMGEGEAFRIASSRFVGMPEEFKKATELKRLQSMMKEGRIFNPILVDQYQQELRDFLRSEGYLDIEISRQRSENEEGGHDFVFEISPGPRYQIRHVIVSGLRRTKVEVIRRELLLKPGNYYRAEDLEDTTSEILRLGIARSVDIRIFEKDAKTGELILMVSVDEASRFRFETGPGYGSVEGLRGVFRGTYANIGGTGRRLNLAARASRKLEEARTPNPAEFLDPEEIPFFERRISLEYFEPSILATRVDGRLVLSHSKESRRQFGVTSYAVAGSLDWRITRNISFIPEYRVEYSNPFNVEITDGIIASDPEASRLHSLRNVFRFSFLDDNFSPVSGYRGNFRGEVFDSRLGGDLNFFIFETTHDVFQPVYRPLYRRPVGLAVSLNAGFSKAYGSTEEVPVEKRFRLGGERSVRGYAEDGILLEDQNGGRSRFFFRTELNFPLTGTVDLLGFFDGGNVYAENGDFNPFDLRYGTGFGFRLNTPVGPLKFGYAFIVKPRPGEDSGRIYFDVGAI